jgi:hypothetical protein
MGTAIPQQQESCLGLAWAAGPMAWRAAVPGPGHAGRREEPIDGWAADREPLVGPELLGQVCGVQARIAAPGKYEDLLLQGGREAMGSGPAPIPVAERPSACEPHPGQQPPGVAQTQSQGAGGLLAGEAVGQHQSQGVIPVNIALGHRNQIALHRPSLLNGRAYQLPVGRVTESLNN